MEKIQKQVYTMEMFMRLIRDKDIRDDADVQRASGQWSNEQINELIVTVLTEGYVPPIFIGEDLNGQKWLIDGLQRSTSLEIYRHGNYKVTASLRNPVISFRAKQKNENGAVMKDEKGNVVWRDSEFDIKGKTYSDLPDELKKRFDTYQIETVIFEDCTMEKMSELIQIYNNHTPMNATQKAFTYVSNYAREVKEILNSRFFLDYSAFTQKEKTKGAIERAVLESVMCIFHFDNWNKNTKKIGIYLNQNSSKSEFSKLKEYLSRLEKVITDDVKNLFNSKDCFLWLALFGRFCNLGLQDEQFVSFLKAFIGGLNKLSVNGRVFDDVDKGKSTKDKKIVAVKLNILTDLMYEFLHISSDEAQKNTGSQNSGEMSAMDLAREFVDQAINESDLDLHRDNLKAWTVDIPLSARIREKENLPSMIALAAFAFQDEENCDDTTMIEWFKDYERRNKNYLLNQQENFLKMRDDLLQFITNRHQTSA